MFKQPTLVQILHSDEHLIFGVYSFDNRPILLSPISASPFQVSKICPTDHTELPKHQTHNGTHHCQYLIKRNYLNSSNKYACRDRFSRHCKSVEVVVEPLEI